MKIKKVYIGIPKELKSEIFWVSREFRKNELSFKIGGTDVIVEYTNKKVFGYDWVKYPGRYVKKIFDKEFLSQSNMSELEFIKQHISRIFARKYDADKYEIEPFVEVWNNKNYSILPYPLLDKFTYTVYANYLQFFLHHLDFAKLYLSIHYPFNYNFLVNNWSYLKSGTAHYSVFLSDTDTIYTSEFGLVYNKNIRWNSKLRAKFEYGFDNPFIGYVEGTGDAPVEFDEKDYLDNIIPLDKIKEIELRNDASISHWSSCVAPYLVFEDIDNFEGPTTLNAEEIFENFGYLNFKGFKDIVNKKSKLTCLLNDSIWENTLQYIIDDSFCDKIIEELKK